MLARAICLRLLEHLARAAASRTFWTAGRSRPIRIAMMAMTTSSSIRVKPAGRPGEEVTGVLSSLQEERAQLGGAGGDSRLQARRLRVGVALAELVLLGRV